MTQEPFLVVNQQLNELIAETHQLGAAKTFDPFLTLSFLTLSVIPERRSPTKDYFILSIPIDSTLLKTGEIGIS